MQIFLIMGLYAATLAALDKQSEAALKAQLAAVQAARAQALKENAALSAALDKATKAVASSGQETAKAVNSNMAAVKESSAKADANARGAQFDADAMTYIIQQAAVRAAAADTAAQQAAERSREMQVYNVTALVAGPLCVLLGVVVVAVNASRMAERNHQWMVEDADRKNVVMEKVEANTNHITEALVAATAKASFIDGANAAEASGSASTAIDKEAQK